MKFSLIDREYQELDKKYKIDNPLKLRMYFKTEKKFKNNKSMLGYIFPYINGKLSEEDYFCTAKHVSEGILGDIIYIPEVIKTDDSIKLSDPSPLRNIIKFVFGEVIENSDV